MLCKDVIRRPVEFVLEHDTVEVAARRMAEANVGFLPVCDESREVVGVVTDRDLALRVCAEGLKPSKTHVEDIMTRTVVWCGAGDEIKIAQQLMVEHHRSRVVVLDGQGKLAGVISLSDIAALGQPFAAETLREVARREALRH
jgi:CBS domain-containing protein